MTKGELISLMGTLSDLEQAFIDRVWNHDVTYSYSDDMRVWREGDRSMSAIRAIARELDPQRAQMIWNAKMDASINDHGRPGEMTRWYDSLLGPLFGR